MAMQMLLVSKSRNASGTGNGAATVPIGRLVGFLLHKNEEEMAVYDGHDPSSCAAFMYLLVRRRVRVCRRCLSVYMYTHTLDTLAGLRHVGRQRLSSVIPFAVNKAAAEAERTTI